MKHYHLMVRTARGWRYVCEPGSFAVMRFLSVTAAKAHGRMLKKSVKVIEVTA